MMTGLDELIGEMAANGSRGACDQDFHITSSLVPLCFWVIEL
jgi:hypothetical protein